MSTSASDASTDASPDTPPFLDHIAGFITRIDSLAGTFPLATVIIEGAGRLATISRDKYVKDNGAEVEGTGAYTLPADKLSAFMRLDERSQKVQIAARTIPRSFVVSLVSEFDAFVSGLIRLYYKMQPDALKASERTLTLSDLLELGTIDVARDYIIEKEIETILRKSHAEQFEILEKRLAIPLRSDLDIWPQFIEITERRNLFVHNNGIVTRHYLDTCRRVGADCSNISRGDQLEASHQYFRSAHRAILELGIKLGHVMWRKVVPGERDEADRHLAGRVIYDLIFQKRYALAIKLGDFATATFKQFSSDYNRRMLVINRSQAYRWSGNVIRANEILDREDWSASSTELQLAVASLRHETSSVIALMKQLGPADRPGKDGYREWPIFTEVRKTAEFQAAFEAIYGEALSVVSLQPEQPAATIKLVSPLEVFSEGWDQVPD